MQPIYKTELRTISIKHIDVELYCINNVDELFNRLLSEDANIDDVKDERIPYWADLWPSAIALAEHLVENKIITPGTRILELGCGLGLPGIVAGKLGGNLIFTDYMQAPLDFAKKNWELNNSSEAEFRLLDWRKPDVSLTADIILASDLAYESRSFEYLASTLKNLCMANGKIILSEPNRVMAKPFLEKLENHFKAEHYVRRVNFNKLESTINILTLQL